MALTVNQISTLKDFQNLYKLRELYLRRNNVSSNLDELKYLSGLQNLKVLNLGENPISSDQGGLPFYRLTVISHLPWLEKLDDIPISYEEL